MPCVMLYAAPGLRRSAISNVALQWDITMPRKRHTHTHLRIDVESPSTFGVVGDATRCTENRKHMSQTYHNASRQKHGIVHINNTHACISPNFGLTCI